MRAINARRAGVGKAAIFSVGTVALAAAIPINAHAQAPGASQLPPVQIDEPNRKPRRQQAAPHNRGPATATRTPRRNPTRTAEPAPRPAPVDTQDTRTGTVGVYANSTAVATKTNTPLVDIPQSLTILTKSFIQDQSFQSIDDAARYVPGVIPHQGEGNRDELVIRGVDSSANFFVNGFRDDVQYFRDLYNTQSIEVLKGPSALIFGRGAGGGILNRTLKEADWSTVRQVTLQTGSYLDRRVAVDVGRGINENVAVRFNAFYEQSDTFRDFGHLERYGINPTISLRPTDDTKVKLSYEVFHEERLADRGNPSQGLNPAAARFNPTTPFVSNVSTFFGSPIYNGTYADVHTVIGAVEHDFGGGLTVKNATMFASYLRGYRNIYPGNGALPARSAPIRPW